MDVQYRLKKESYKRAIVIFSNKLFSISFDIIWYIEHKNYHLINQNRTGYSKSRKIRFCEN